MSRNIVLITVDSLRADHCGFMGYGKDTTPTLDEIAKNGVAFENAIAPAPSTPESMTAVHTGDFVTMYEGIGEGSSILESRRANVRQNLQNRPTIAEALSDEGYETAAITPNTFASRHFGFSKGFDHFTDFLETSWSAQAYQKVFEMFLQGRTWLTPLRMAIQRVRNGEMFKPWNDFYDQILAQVEAMTEPYFLWVFLLDVHLPYFVNRSYRNGFSLLDMWRYNLRLYRSDPEFTEQERELLIEMYDASIKQMDDFLAEITTDLEEDNVVYLIHADHGEAFGEHGTYGHEPYVYEENVHVPLVIGNVDRNVDRRNPVSLSSIAPTIVSIADGTPRFRSSGLFEENHPAVMTNPQGRSAVRTQAWKYVRNEPANEELYHLGADPRETVDRSGENPDKLGIFRDVMSDRLRTWREAQGIEKATVDLASKGHM